MSNPQSTRGHFLGMSVGATNLAGTRDGQTAVIRPSELTVGGLQLTGFVDRVGDPVPLVAADGSKHQPERLLAEALGAMARSVTEGMPVSAAAVTVPAHWNPSVVGTLRGSLRDGLSVVSDATAALTALRANPGLPTRGVIVLCDFGGSGTSITLADAASDFAPIGETVRFPDFSGDHIDQALLTHVVAGLSDAAQSDPFGTAMVGSLVRLRDECRRAKERLSAETATAVVADLPGHRADIRVTRFELEDLIAVPLTDFLAALDDTLERNHVPLAAVSVVATVGGGARIPLITQRLSEHLRAAVVTTPNPALTAAEGAALIAHRSRVVEAATTMTPVPGTAVPMVAMTAGEPSTTFRALAWSDDENVDDVVPYAEDPDATEYYQRPADSRPDVRFRHEETQDDAPPRRSPIVLFGLSAAAAVIASTVFGITLLSSDTTSPVDAATPVEAATTVAPSPAPAASALNPASPMPQAPQVTTVVVSPPQRSIPVHPRPAAPVTQPPVTPTTTTPTTTAPTTTTPTTPTTPTTTPTTTTPAPPPIDPGPGNGTTTPPPPIDPGPGNGNPPPPIDPGPGNGGTGTTTPPIDPGAGAGA